RHDECREREREPVDRARPERERPRPEGVASDAEERHREQDLLPRRDRREHRPPDARRIERRHRRVVEREADDEEGQRHRRTPPHGCRARAEQERVERRLDRRHGPSVQRDKAHPRTAHSSTTPLNLSFCFLLAMNGFWFDGPETTKENVTAMAGHSPLALDETIGQRLKRLRLERGLSQRELAAPGVSYAYISRIEAGTRQPSVKALRRLAAKLGVTAEYL